MRRAGKIAFAAVGGTVALALVLPVAMPLAIGPAINNIDAWRLRAQVDKLELPAGTEIVETGSWVGNTGNGNHTEVIAAAIFRTDLTAKELEAALASQSSLGSEPEALPILNDTSVPHYFDEIFPELADGGRELVASAPGNWFAWYQVRSAATQLDIRGH
ncbi:MAG: hypothetical protein LBO20_05575 [Bifidobacteriaceae bacterium]|jgi:hypothetical protein|nr:hypothetical protein [Bifidobacteriaceae bacterium]